MMTIRPDVEETAFSADAEDGTRLVIFETPHLKQTKFDVQVTPPGRPTVFAGRIVQVDGSMGFLPYSGDLRPMSASTLNSLSDLVAFAEGRETRL